MFSLSSFSLFHGDQALLTDASFAINAGELHILKGSNGSGKTSFLLSLLGHPAYTIKTGSAVFKGVDILSLSTEQRARLGILLIFQYPLEVPGVKVMTFLHEAYSAFTGNQISILDFMPRLSQALSQVGLSDAYAERALNDGFSGGEKKRLELAQILLLQPQLVLIDELDSGLDEEGRALMVSSIAALRTQNPSTMFLVITHYQTMQEQLHPEAVHTLHNGTLTTVRSL